MKRDVIVMKDDDEMKNTCVDIVGNDDWCYDVLWNEMNVWMNMSVWFHTQSHSGFQTTSKCLYSSNIRMWTHQGSVVNSLSKHTQTSSQTITLVS